MKKPFHLLLSLFILLLSFSTVLLAQQASVRTGNVHTNFLNPEQECTGTGELIYDDGSFENGYGWNATLVNNGIITMLFTPSEYPWHFTSACISFTQLSSSNLDFDIVVYANDGTGGAPGTLVGEITGLSATGIPAWPTLAWYEYDISSLPALDAGSWYIGVRWNNVPGFPGTYIGSDESTTTPLQTGYCWDDYDGQWMTNESLWPGYRAMGIRTLGIGQLPVMPIAQAIEDLDNDYVPDHLGETVTVQGVVFSPNYQTTHNSFYISDFTAGTDIFMYSPPLFTWEFGDMLEITGEVSQYNGMTEIIPADSTGWVFVSSGNPTPDPVVLTLGQYLANAEMYEGSLVGFVSLTLVGGTWPGAGSSANLQLSDGIDTVTFRIDSDTDIDGQPEPTWPADVIGIGSQYDSSPPYDGGYQIFPRYYATDFLPAGTLPVELTSFTARADLNSVVMNWSTASELNNNGFEIQRNSGSGYITIGFVKGQGTSTQTYSYSYVDQDVPVGHYTYRLKQVDFQGAYSFSSEVSVDINPLTYSLGQNYPNPFNPSTIIDFNLKVDSKVSLKVFNVLGQEVTQLIKGAMTAGNHQVDFNASKLNSGVYLYRLEATGIDGSTFSAVKKMMLTK